MYYNLLKLRSGDMLVVVAWGETRQMKNKILRVSSVGAIYKMINSEDVKK